MSARCMVANGPHSDDVVEVWHGLDTPAIGCGFHATYYAPELFEAHRDALASERERRYHESSQWGR